MGVKKKKNSKKAKSARIMTYNPDKGKYEHTSDMSYMEWVESGEKAPRPSHAKHGVREEPEGKVVGEVRKKRGFAEKSKKFKDLKNLYDSMKPSQCRCRRKKKK